MDMNGIQRIEASREAVYAALNDTDVLRQCIPGCDAIERTSEHQMDAKATLRIGPVKATFTGKVTLSDLDPPNGYTISGEGAGGMAGFAKGRASVTLAPDGEATILTYLVSAEIGGKIAQLGGRLIDGTAKKLAGEFFEKFGAIVGAPTSPSDAAPVDPSIAEALAGEQAEDAPTEKKGWFGRILGTSSAAVVLLTLSAGLCCIDGHHHEADAALSLPTCTSHRAAAV
ncbi:carbon monoxide dehydrogenase subunit G [Beijerinckia sp. L45]|uniref:SRPBCC family protein n=1 Tax=Beijerinckia sp. L45 TaxID=1641855 RepID=UPI00131D2352|nr:carbon monoxide dehydrogenase subunit G [Beijerinckia sp. L45]